MAATFSSYNQAVTPTAAAASFVMMPTQVASSAVAAAAPPRTNVTAPPPNTPAVSCGTGGQACAAPQQVPAKTAPAAKRVRTKSPNDAGAAVPAAAPATLGRKTTKAAAPAQTEAFTPEEETPTPGESETAIASKDWLIVAKSVRTMLKSMPNSMHCGADALPMLNVRVQELLTEASARASGNSRKTLKACDF